MLFRKPRLIEVERRRYLNISQIVEVDFRRPGIARVKMVTGDVHVIHGPAAVPLMKMIGVKRTFTGVSPDPEPPLPLPGPLVGLSA